MKAGYLHLSLNVTKEIEHQGNFLLKRDNDHYEIPLVKNIVNYQTKLKVGSNLQPFTVFLDSGSSDLIIQDISNINCNGAIFNFSIPEIPWLGGSPTPSETVTNTQAFSNINNNEKSFGVKKEGGIKEFLLNANIKLNTEKDYDLMNLTTLSDYKSEYINCELTGQFDSSDSITFKDLNLPYRSTYLDKNIYFGNYVKDDITLGDIKLKDYQFALINSSTNGASSILGLGFPSLEAGVNYGLPEYPNFPQRLKVDGKINVASYSLNLTPDLPSILFGAVDLSLAKNETIYKVPIIDKVKVGMFSTEREYIAAELNSFGFEKGNPDLIGSISTVFDSGSGNSALTPEMQQSILDRYPFEAIPKELYIIHKEEIGNDSIYFNFNGNDIGVHLKDYFSPIIDLNGTITDYYLYQPSASPSGSNYVLIGQDILKNIYLVVDFEKKELGIAELDYDSTKESKIVTIDSDGIPNSVSGPGSPYKSHDDELNWNINGSNEFSAWHWVLKYLVL